jgi:YihY family inner membrane protein
MALVYAWDVADRVDIFAGLGHAFKFYVTHFANFPKVYGALSSFIVIMTWIYISVAILLTGAKADHIIDKINAKGIAA